MRVHLAYGDDGLDVDLPDGADVIAPSHAPALPDPPAALRDALARPINARPLAEVVGADDHVAIVFSDITRPTPNRLMATTLLRSVEERGVAREHVTLIVGGGLHRALTRAELDGMFGPEITGRYRVVNHDARDPDGVTFLRRYPGERRGGVYLNSHYLRASVRVVTGFVEPHIFAGYSGGGKGVLPGVAAGHNIMRNHSAPNLLHPNATYCVGRGNPIFDEMRDVALASDVTFLCNVTLNDDRALSGFWCGDLVAAHDAAIAEVDRTALRPVPHEYDIVVSTNGGYPADLNLYQSDQRHGGGGQGGPPRRRDRAGGRVPRGRGQRGLRGLPGLPRRPAGAAGDAARARLPPHRPVGHPVPGHGATPGRRAPVTRRSTPPRPAPRT